MKNRHGTPFEHAAMKFYMEMPIFVFREFHRHRIGWSYNEMSGRYTQLPPTFYVPSASRPLVQQGKPGHYEFVAGTPAQHKSAVFEMQMLCRTAYSVYEKLLADDVAKEVARMVLPVNTYSAQFATCNPRSLMAFLSLRTRAGNSKFPSYPMREIETVAEQMEAQFLKHFPLTWRAFDENGRVAP
jgi:thymidylate synthase (FAD)